MKNLLPESPETPFEEIRIPVNPPDWDPRQEEPGTRSPGVRIIDLVGDDEDDDGDRGPKRPLSHIISL